MIGRGERLLAIFLVICLWHPYVFLCFPRFIGEKAEYFADRAEKEMTVYFASRADRESKVFCYVRVGRIILYFLRSCQNK